MSQQPSSPPESPGDEKEAQNWLQNYRSSKKIKQMTPAEYMKTPSPQEKRNRHRALFYTSFKSTKRKEYREFKRGIKKNFPDTDVFYLVSVYKLYTKSEEMAKALNAYFDRGETQNQMFDEWMNDLVSQNRPMMTCITGYTGSGKSRVAQCLASTYFSKCKKNSTFHVDPDNLEDKMSINLFPPESEVMDAFLTYDFDSLMTTVQQRMKPGNVCIDDEVQKAHGEGSGTLMDNLVNAINACTRRLKLSLIYCSPEEISLPEIKCYVRVIATNRQKQETLAVLSIPDAERTDAMTMGIVTINAKQEMVFSQWYDDHSRQVKERIKARGGGSGVHVDVSELVQKSELLQQAIAGIDLRTDLDEQQKEDFKKFVLGSRAGMKSFAKSLDAITAKAGMLDAIVDFTIFKLKNQDDGSEELDDEQGGDETFIDAMDEATARQHRNDQNEIDTIDRQGITNDSNHALQATPSTLSNDAPNPSNEIDRVNTTNQNEPETTRFEFDEDDALTRYASKGPEEASQVDCFKMNKRENISQDRIVSTLHLSVTPRTVGDWISKITRWLDTDAAGHAYERWHAAFLRHRDNGLIERVDCEGVRGKDFPDNVEYFVGGDVDIYSLKCCNLARREKWFSKDEVNPEMRLARRLVIERPDNRVRLFLKLYNRHNGFESIKQLDPADVISDGWTLPAAKGTKKRRTRSHHARQ